MCGDARGEVGESLHCEESLLWLTLLLRAGAAITRLTHLATSVAYQG